MTKYEMVAILNMVVNGEYNSADVQSVINALNEEIRADLNKSASKPQKNLLKACKNVLKDAEKYGQGRFDGSWIVDGVQYVLDEHRVIINRTPLALKELAPQLKPFDVKKLLADAEPNFNAHIPLPTLAELEDAIKKCKAEIKANKIKDAKILYTIKCGGLYWTYNAEFLRDGIMATGATYAKITNGKNRFPILMCGADADYFLLPVNIHVEREGAYIA